MKIKIFILIVAMVLFSDVDLIAGDFTDNGDGTVTDNNTGLMWQQGEGGSMNWENAITYCEGLSLAGYSDWRLPNIKELESITDDSLYDPAIDTAYFPDAHASDYWSSTSDPMSSARAFDIQFKNGDIPPFAIVGWGDKSNNYYVRCVRGGQCTPSVKGTLSIPDTILPYYDGGLGHDGNYVWLPTHGSGAKVYKINPSNGSILDSYDQNHYTPGVSSVGGLAYDSVNNLIYNYVYPYGPIYAVNANTLVEVSGSSIDVPANWIHDIAFDSVNQILWAVTGDSISSNYRVYKIDPSDGSVIGSFTSPTNAPAPIGLVWDGSYLWVSEGSDEYLYQVDAGQALADGNCENAIIQKLYMPDIGAPVGRLAWGGSFLWTASQSEGLLYKIDVCN